MSPEQSQSVSLDQAQATWESGQLRVSTEPITRSWRLVPCGLATTQLRDEQRDFDWIGSPVDEPDWSIFALTSQHTEAELLDVALAVVENDSWTSPHIQAQLLFRYSQTDTELRYRIWAYPQAPGLRTQVGIRWIGERDSLLVPSFLGGSWGESLSIDMSGLERLAAGYYNDTQHRNYDHTPLLREEHDQGLAEKQHVCDWANLLRLTDHQQKAGLTLVKESHKCVNQPGVDTGEFVIDRQGVRVTGLALVRDGWYESQAFCDGWANWVILHGHQPDQAGLALKQFDRCRYPVDPDHDLYAMANTWGSRGAGWRSRSAATQENILRELQAAADIGIDGVQIDDGWQCEPGNPPRPFDVDWSAPNGERFPDGWSTVRKAAEELGLDLGLWAPASVDADQLLQSVRSGRFRRLKLDFMHLHNRTLIDENVSKARWLVEQMGGDLRVNWDVTENNPRVGYFFARESGCVYLANRENGQSPLRSHVHIRYTPRLTFREAWHLAHHLNLNQFQITFQNKDLVEPDVTNVHEYSHGYLLAITLMSQPVFFQEVQKLSAAARDEIRPIMAAYRRHRQAMNRGFVFPIGNEPDDYQWAGFQCHDPATGTGYLLVFRELYNEQPTMDLRLPFVAGHSLETTDVLTGQTSPLAVDPDGQARFALDEPGTFAWLAYDLA